LNASGLPLPAPSPMDCNLPCPYIHTLTISVHGSSNIFWETKQTSFPMLLFCRKHSLLRHSDYNLPSPISYFGKHCHIVITTSTTISATISITVFFLCNMFMFPIDCPINLCAILGYIVIHAVVPNLRQFGCSSCKLYPHHLRASSKLVRRTFLS
jgi:hypothetical protein